MQRLLSHAGKPRTSRVPHEVHAQVSIQGSHKLLCLENSTSNTLYWIIASSMLGCGHPSGAMSCWSSWMARSHAKQCHRQCVWGHTRVFAQGSVSEVWTPGPMVAGMSRALMFLLGRSWSKSAIFYTRCRDEKDILAWSVVISQTISLDMHNAQWYE